MAHYTQDDAFHEIQLNGKQLFFLFMAATVVSVMIFLCGVLVGRGVRAERGTADAETAAESPTADAVSQPPSSVGTAATAPAIEQVSEPPPPAADEVSIAAPPTADRAASRADAPQPTATAASATPPPRLPAAPAPVPAPAQLNAKVNSNVNATAAQTEGWVVQVAALNVRAEADAFARRLVTKGYAAYVTAPPAGTSVYRVRVGNFKTKREADTIAGKLTKEEQLKPWVTSAPR